MSNRSAEHIFDCLVERIVDGQMLPGETLHEVSLAAQFGVSRTPVREALHRLAQIDLAERGPRRAFVVRRMKASDLAELFEAVGEVESALAALAALRMTEIERQRLGDVLNEGERAGDNAAAYGEANRRFHRAIRDGGHNRILATTLDELNLRTLAWRGAQFRERGDRLATSREEHQRIAAAILAQDPNATREEMRRHVAASFLVLSDILAERDRGGSDGPD